MAQHNDLGSWGEDIAVAHLLREGATIRERNWRSGHLETDIIASKGDTFIFAEVKTRADMDEDPLEAIDSRKRAHMIRSAAAYLAATGIPAQCRFDLFAIRGTPADHTCEHIPSAFEPGIKTYR